jgi:hypothetical protein
VKTSFARPSKKETLDVRSFLSSLYFMIALSSSGRVIGGINFPKRHFLLRQLL